MFVKFSVHDVNMFMFHKCYVRGTFSAVYEHILLVSVKASFVCVWAFQLCERIIFQLFVEECFSCLFKCFKYICVCALSIVCEWVRERKNTCIFMVTLNNVSNDPSYVTVLLYYLFNLPLVLPFTDNHQHCLAEGDQISRRLMADPLYLFSHGLYKSDLWATQTLQWFSWN